MMPYRWTDTDPTESRLSLWPHRSLTARGFVAFFGATAALVAVPMLMTLGSPAVWMVLPFAGVTLWGLWAAIGRNSRDARALSEELVLTRDSIALTRHSPQGRQDWQANPHWVRVRLHPEGGPVPDYLTLKGNGREVELGAFLSDTERRALHGELADRLARLR